MRSCETPLVRGTLAFLACLAWCGAVGSPPHVGPGVALFLLGCVAPGAIRIWVAMAGVALVLGSVHGLGGSPTAPHPDRPTTVWGHIVSAVETEEGRTAARVAPRVYRQKGSARVLAEPFRTSLPGSVLVSPGARVRVQGYLRPGMPLANGNRATCGEKRLFVKSPRLVRSEASGSWLSRPLEALRSRLERAGAAHLSRPGPRGLFPALLLGRTDRLPDEMLLGLRRSGLGHLLAVSGLHVGLVAAGAFLLGGLWSRRHGSWLAILATIGYAALVGPRPSVVRAAVMVLVAIGAGSMARRASGVECLAVAVVGLLFTQPDLVRDLSFRLTCSAVAAILLLGPRFEARWLDRPLWLRRSLAVSLAAQLGTMPWTASSFFHVSPAAPVLNLVAVPCTALLLGSYMLWGLCGLVAPALAAWTAPAVDLLSFPLEVMAGWPAKTTLSAPVAWSVPVALGVAAAAVGILRLARRALLVVVAIGLVASVLGGNRAPRAYQVWMLDVGQGESLLLSSPKGVVLVDGGGWRAPGFGPRHLLPALARLGVRRVDAVIVSHVDRDHCGGLAEVAVLLPVREAWMTPAALRHPCGRSVAGRAGAVRLLWRGERATAAGWSFETLHPPPGRRGAGNEDSLVLMAVGAANRILLTGDIGERTEREILRRWEPSRLGADLLKVAHHGSRFSSSLDWLRTVRPSVALVSSGVGNLYDHPAAETLRRLASVRAATLSTRRLGRVGLELASHGRTRLISVAVPRHTCGPVAAEGRVTMWR